MKIVTPSGRDELGFRNLFDNVFRGTPNIFDAKLGAWSPSPTADQHQGCLRHTIRISFSICSVWHM